MLLEPLVLYLSGVGVTTIVHGFLTASLRHSMGQTQSKRVKSGEGSIQGINSYLPVEWLWSNSD